MIDGDLLSTDKNNGVPNIICRIWCTLYAGVLLQHIELLTYISVKDIKGTELRTKRIFNFRLNLEIRV